MSGIKYFILGFCLSVSSVALYTQLQTSSATNKKTSSPSRYVSIDLFKAPGIQTKSASLSTLFIPIQKESIEIKEIPSEKEMVVSAQNDTLSPDGIEDDEILSINMDADIPIEFSPISTQEQHAEVLSDDTEDKVAMLPEEDSDSISEAQDESPWAVVRAGSNIKNKKLLEKFDEAPKNNLFTEDVTQTAEIDDNISYKVAEKIKQSIIFPIPNEILNDENLTPTFIHKTTPKPSTNTSPAQKKSSQPVRVVEPKQALPNNNSKASDKSILNSISTWFKEPPVLKKSTPAEKKKTPPTYSSDSSISVATAEKTAEKKEYQTQPNNLASLYESLQQTKKEHTQKRIIPTELKLSFQPGRAEISGSTLQWLKTFSEATFREDTYLQVRLDIAAPSELQRRRLNLLYTIFMNNGVDFNKIDTVFSQAEADAFIIRVMRKK